jgi:hypothetical protein
MKIIKSLFRIIVVGVISLTGFAELQTQTVPAGQGGSVTFFKPRPEVSWRKQAVGTRSVEISPRLKSRNYTPPNGPTAL